MYIILIEYWNVDIIRLINISVVVSVRLISIRLVTAIIYFIHILLLMILFLFWKSIDWEQV